MNDKMNYRPKVHFSPEKGWINDPNGMVYIDGEYHMFFQHYPHGISWGPMHWGHAKTGDLLHWEELPIALYPDELGFIFSGSCVYDKDNVSGFGTQDIPMLGVKGHAPLIAVFTSHYGKMVDGKHVSQEQQSIAYSTDLVHFEKYYGNPVIPNTEKKDFRDPKVFWNPIRKCYSLVVAAGLQVEFYASTDLKNWEKTGEFKAGTYGMDGICECPDCFPIIAEDGTEKWILIISMIVPEAKRGLKKDCFDRLSHITQYYVGAFDGDTFHDTERSEQPLLIDYGTDNYAPVTFQNLKEKVLIGWGNNWEYARSCMTPGFNGRMTLPRRIGLRRTDAGYRLTSAFEGMGALKAHTWKLTAGENRMYADAFGIKVKAAGCGAVTISNALGEEIRMEIAEDEIIVDRRRSGNTDFHEVYAREEVGYNRAPRLERGGSEMEIIWDRSILEVIADNGLAGFATAAYPNAVYDLVTVEGDLEAEAFEVK